MYQPNLTTNDVEVAAMPVPRTRPALIVAILIAGDLLATGAAIGVAFGVRHLSLGPLDSAPYRSFLPLVLLLPMAYAYFGLYPGYGVGAVDQLRRIFRATSLVALLMIAATFLLQMGALVSRLVLVFWAISAVVLVTFTRALLRAVLAHSPIWGEPVLILGAAKTGAMVAQKLSADPGLGLSPLACLDDDPLKHGAMCGGVPVIGALWQAAELAQTHHIRTAVVAMPGLGRHRILRIVEELANTFPALLIIPDLLGLTSLWVTPRDMHGVLGLELRHNLLIGWNRFLKRVLDLAVAVPALAVAGPVILLSGLAVKINSPGPAFYAQEREGLNGRRVRVHKIRTMVPNAEAVLETYLSQNPAARDEWSQYMKLRNDPRIVPRVGHFLRRFSLDELPQLWNIVKGEMSLVGPRPFPDYHLRQFPQAFRELRRKVLPGLTGLWQVSARSNGDLAVQEELDSYYIRNWSLWLDVYLLARTVWAVLFGTGAY